ncbi:MAG: glycoside hydrolase family 43 protein, partial [Nocardioidaceae bacterium]
SGAGPSMPTGEFTNPIAEGADPCVVRDGNRYLWCQSEGNVAVSIWVSDRLTSLGTRHVVWTAPAEGPCSKQVWAPELIRVGDHWYIYFAASDGDGKNHQAYVLVADSDDPLGGYTLEGPLWTADGDVGAAADNVYAIDMTVLEHSGRHYAVWSGWPDRTRQVQHLYIRAMSSPVGLTGPRVQICAPDDYLWERIDETAASDGLNEGPQVLSRGGRTFLVYSCSASYFPTYKLGLLELTGDPMDAAGWRKHPEPVFRSTEDCFGVGHDGFVRSLDGKEWWHVFHAKLDRRPGWRRAIWVQPLTWTADDFPLFGQPASRGIPLPVPSATPRHEITDARDYRFTDAATGAADFDYYGHHQFLDPRPDGVHLGVVPAHPVNDYRSGEKLLLRDGCYRDVRVVAQFAYVDGRRDVGVLFRASGAALGFDGQHGYFAALSPRRSRLLLGKMDGFGWVELASAPYDVDRAGRQQLVIEARGSRIVVAIPGSLARLSVTDDDHPTGTVGLRVVDTHARFERLRIEPFG